MTSHPRRRTCKCICPPKWILMIMTHTIKELTCLWSYEQDLKSLKWERAINDSIFAKETVDELQRGSFIIFYFEFEYMITVLLRGTRKYSMELLKCLEELTKNHSSHYTHSTVLSLQNLYGSEVPTLCRKFRPTSEVLCYFRENPLGQQIYTVPEVPTPLLFGIFVLFPIRGLGQIPD